MAEDASVIQCVLGNLVAEGILPLPVVHSPRSRRDVSYRMLADEDSLEFDVYSEVHTVMLPESCWHAPCCLCLLACPVTVNFTFPSVLFSHPLGILGDF